jgi:predicted dinucleotide-binding enzyme
MSEPASHTTAVVGVGNLGRTIARHLVRGNEDVVLAADVLSHAQALADELGPRARAASVQDALAGADTVVFAVWLDTMRELIAKNAGALAGKVIVDPSNPIAFDTQGQMSRTLPEGQSAASVIDALLPAGARYVKAFGTLAADSLAAGARREPEHAVLFYATDDDVAATTVEHMIRASGFDPVKAGGVADAGRLEGPGGDLQQFALGRLVNAEEARVAAAGTHRSG